MLNFGLLGAAGYVAPRHMQAIRSVGGDLIGACDPYDGVGVIDRYFPNCRFFTEIERFDRYLEKARRTPGLGGMNYLTICTPNYLHDAHCRMALRLDADAICEKPLVISPWNLDQLAELEREYQRKIFNVLQLRLHPEAVRLKNAFEDDSERHHVVLDYITPRGPWYHQSWKGDAEKSGGVAMNIGIHFFDLLIWIFGACGSARVTQRDDRRMAGSLELANADVSWRLSISAEDLPAAQREGQGAFRALKIGDERFDFSGGFNDLHDQVYSAIVNGEGFTIEDARPSIELVNRLRAARVVS